MSSGEQVPKKSGKPASEQPQCKPASGGKAKQGKGKQVSEAILTPEEEAEQKKADDTKYYAKRSELTAVIGDAIDGKFPMTTEQRMQLLAQIALMRFSDESLQMDFGGKTLKDHLGKSYAHFLGNTIYAIQKEALARFMEELPKLSLEIQTSVIFGVMRYYTPLSPLSDELGSDCPSLAALNFKYHMLYLCSQHGIVSKTICDYGVAKGIVKIESLKTFFKVSGQNAFMLKGMTQLYSVSCRTVTDKVLEDIGNLTKRLAKLDADKKALDAKVADVTQKLADVSIAPKLREGLTKNQTSLKDQLATVVVAIATTSAKLAAMESLSTSVLAVEKTLVKQGGGTAETFFAGQNTEDWLSRYFASFAPCISHNDDRLLLPISFTFESLFEMAKTQDKHNNDLLTVANAEAKKRMAKAGFQTETEEQRTRRAQMEEEAAFLSEEDRKKAEAAFESIVPNICEGVVVKVTLTVGDETLECNFKVKNEEKKL